MTPESNKEPANVTLVTPENDTSSPNTDNISEQDYEKYLKRRKNRPRNLGIVAIAVILLAVVGIAIYLSSKGETPILGSDSFFLPENGNADAKTALFDKDGKRLTDFVFQEHGVFVDGYTFVRNADGQYGILNSHGKMTSDFGKYDKITARGGIYIVEKDGKAELVLGTGEKIENIDAKEAELLGSESSAFAILASGRHYEVFSAKGQRMLDFEDDTVPAISDAFNGEVTLISLPKKLYILDNETLSVRKEIANNTNRPFIALTYATDKNVILLAYNDGAIAKSAIIENDLKDFSESCDDVMLTGTNEYTLTESRLLCLKDGKSLYISEAGEVTDLDTNKYLVYNEHYYGKYLQDKSIFRFYHDGEVVKSVGSDSIPAQYGKFFIITNYNNNNVTQYDYEGKEHLKIDSINNRIAPIDDSVSIVYEGYSGTLYENGKRIGDDSYTNILKISDEYYLATDTESHQYILRKNLNTAKSLDDDVTGVEYIKEANAYVIMKGSQKEVCKKDLSQLFTTDGEVSYLGSYYVSYGKEVAFYNKNGEKIHSYEQ